jgi:hypothetical protein
MSNNYQQNTDQYQEDFTQVNQQDQEYDELRLDLDDATLDKMLINSLNLDRDHWNNAPWRLQDTDVTNTAFFLGDQLNDREFLKTDIKYKDNRIFSSVRAILSYATGQLAKPDITPSRGDEIYLKGARDIGAALYQHSADEQVEHKVRSAVLNLITRKRGYLKLRFDPYIGLEGDIVTEVCNPEDIIIDRTAGYLKNPNKIYHRIRCTIDELVMKFPSKKQEIYEAFSINRGVYTQTSRYVSYWECWFTYTTPDGPKEGVCWFLTEKHVILDKMPNPNWVYMKSRKKEREANVVSFPPKPFITFNYINMGKSYIDETCLVEQALPLQIALNKRLRQIGDNADYVNGRWVADKNAFSQEDAQKLINKGPKTVALADFSKGGDPLKNVAPQQLGAWVENTVYDYRNEIDGMMGTPSQFKGSDPQKSDTLGRDLMIKQQAGALQDDLVRSISLAMEEYYKMKLQMMRVYYTSDYWFQVKGGDGKFEFILLNGDKLDTNVKVGVQIDSTLPLDKAMIRNTAMQLWSAGNAIDYKTLMEDLGLPNPEIRAERYLKSHIDPVSYLRSIEMGAINTEAEADIQLLIAGQAPEERDNYDEEYFNYFNKVVASNRFAKLQGENAEAAERITAFLIAIQHAMEQSLGLQESINDAGMLPTPAPQPPMDPNAPVDPNAPPQPAPPEQAQPPVPTQ